VLQTLNQGITTFKGCYTHLTFHSTLDASEDETVISVSGYSKSYSIADCKINIKDSMDNLKSVAWNSCWKDLWPQAFNDVQDSPTSGTKYGTFLFQDFKFLVRIAIFREG